MTDFFGEWINHNHPAVATVSSSKVNFTIQWPISQSVSYYFPITAVQAGKPGPTGGSSRSLLRLCIFWRNFMHDPVDCQMNVNPALLFVGLRDSIIYFPRRPDFRPRPGWRVAATARRPSVDREQLPLLFISHKIINSSSTQFNKFIL